MWKPSRPCQGDPSEPPRACVNGTVPAGASRQGLPAVWEAGPARGMPRGSRGHGGAVTSRFGSPGEWDLRVAFPVRLAGDGPLESRSVSPTRRSPSLAGFYAGWGASCGGPVPRGGCGGKAQPHAAQGAPGCPSERPFGFSRRPRQPIRGDAGFTRIMDPSSKGPIATRMPSLRSISLAARFPASHA